VFYELDGPREAAIGEITFARSLRKGAHSERRLATATVVTASASTTKSGSMPSYRPRAEQVAAFPWRVPTRIADGYEESEPSDRDLGARDMFERVPSPGLGRWVVW
jgi:hypothetical protein